MTINTPEGETVSIKATGNTLVDIKDPRGTGLNLSALATERGVTWFDHRDKVYYTRYYGTDGLANIPVEGPELLGLRVNYKAKR